MSIGSESPIIVCASDNNFAQHLAVTLYSALETSSSPLTIYILDGGITTTNQEKITSSLAHFEKELHWIEVDDTALSKLTVGGHISHHTYYRLLIPYILSEDISKIIYLDSDLVINHDITELWNTHFNNSPLLAAPTEHIKTGLKHYKELEIDGELKYFNAGVLVMNLRVWRKEDFGNKIITFIEENPHLIRWHDQDGLNIFFKDSWVELDPRWNVQTPLSQSLLTHTNGRKSSEYKEALDNFPYPQSYAKKIVSDPYIIHFTTDEKPWTFGYNPPHTELYLKTLDKTAWSGVRQTLLQREIALLQHRIKTKGILLGIPAYLISVLRRNS